MHRTKSGNLTRSFKQAVRIEGRLTNLGLGSWPYIGLEDARTRCLENIVTIRQGGDPRQRRKPVSVDPGPSVADPVEAPTSVPALTFGEAAEQWIELHGTGWTDGYREQKERDFRRLPGLLTSPVATVNEQDVRRVLRPHWTARPSVARNMLAAIVAVTEWAVSMGHRTAPIIAKSVRAGLPKHNGKVKHHEAAPVEDVPSIVGRVRSLKARKRDTLLGIEFAILTAARQSEVRGATWNEIDFDARTWTIPGQRMKKGREHVVPLSDAALTILRTLGPGKPDSLIFTNLKGRIIDRNSFRQVLAQRLGLKATMHGFRSSFRDWCGEKGVSREVAELCLAHRIGDATEQAYARSDLLARRREVMDLWARHVTR